MLPEGVAVPPTSAAWSKATEVADIQLNRRFDSLVACLMELLDVDRDGRVSVEEFCRLDELLRLADPEGTGYCTLDHFRDLPCWQLPDVGDGRTSQR